MIGIQNSDQDVEMRERQTQYLDFLDDEVMFVFELNVFQLCFFFLRMIKESMPMLLNI